MNYIEVLSVYLYDLAKLVLGGIIRTRKEFFEQFVSDSLSGRVKLNR